MTKENQLKPQPRAKPLAFVTVSGDSTRDKSTLSVVRKYCQPRLRLDSKSQLSRAARDSSGYTGLHDFRSKQPWSLTSTNNSHGYSVTRFRLPKRPAASNARKPTEDASSKTQTPSVISVKSLAIPPLPATNAYDSFSVLPLSNDPAFLQTFHTFVHHPMSIEEWYNSAPEIRAYTSFVLDMRKSVFAPIVMSSPAVASTLAAYVKATTLGPKAFTESIECRQLQYRALAKANELIRDPEQAFSDAALLCVLMLWCLAAMTHDTVAVWAHGLGLERILHVRQSIPYSTEVPSRRPNEGGIGSLLSSGLIKNDLRYPLRPCASRPTLQALGNNEELVISFMCHHGNTIPKLGPGATLAEPVTEVEKLCHMGLRLSLLAASFPGREKIGSKHRDLPSTTTYASEMLAMLIGPSRTVDTEELLLICPDYLVWCLLTACSLAKYTPLETHEHINEWCDLLRRAVAVTPGMTTFESCIDLMVERWIWMIKITPMAKELWILTFGEGHSTGDVDVCKLYTGRDSGAGLRQKDLGRCGPFRIRV